MDTLAVQTEVGGASWLKIASKIRRQATTNVDGAISRKAYGAFTLSRATLYAGRPDPFVTHRVVLEFCPGKIMRGHNLFASEVCAREAFGFVLDEVEGASGVCLHQAVWLVCRFDVAYTFFDHPARDYLTEAAAYTLPRRERVIYEDGVRFSASSRAELLYDKRVSVAKELAATPEAKALAATLEAEKVEAKKQGHEPRAPLTGTESAVELLKLEERVPGQSSRIGGLIEASELVASGAIRVECRIKGSPNVARFLDLPDARFETVVRDDNAHRMLAAFLAQFSFGAVVPPDDALARLRASGRSSSSALQLIGFREIEKTLGSDQAAFAALGFTAARRRLLTRELTASGLRNVSGRTLCPLVVTRDDLAENRKRDEGERETWRTRRTVWGNYWRLPSHELELLAA